MATFALLLVGLGFATTAAGEPSPARILAIFTQGLFSHADC